MAEPAAEGKGGLTLQTPVGRPVMSPLHAMGQNAYLSIFGFLRISPEDPHPCLQLLL